MTYFDLNIPYTESDRHVTDLPTLKSRRLKLTLKSMELGFTSVAYNRTIKGVMSDSHRCTYTSSFPLTKLIPTSSSFFASVKFHRELLNVAVSSPFRQYNRLTVIVDVPSQASALNAGNPVLKSYDVVAVRPMNQNAFDQACLTSEVDMIAVDFAEKLPFRLKQPMVKAAIKRGVYFEITYSGLLADAQTRRQMISNCKLLVDWTRGKNLIFSSAASSATELRGPLDVANLFSLLGLPMERAKAAISKNCRSLLANALRKKHCYKEAVKVEKIPSDKEVNTEQSLFDEWLKYDPISSGEGDLLLDDMEKAFSSSSTINKTVKTINFSSTLNGLPAHGLQIKDLIPPTQAVVELPDINSFACTAMDTGAVSHKPEEVTYTGTHMNSEKTISISSEKLNYSNDLEAHFFASKTQFTQSQISEENSLPDDGGVHRTTVEAECTPSFDNHASIESPDIDNFVCTAMEAEEAVCKKPEELNHVGIFTNSEETMSISSEKLNYSNDLEANLIASETQFTQSQISEENSLPDDGRVHRTTVEAECTPSFDNHASIEIFNQLNKSSLSGLQLQESNVEKSCDASICAQESGALDGIPDKVENNKYEGPPLASSDICSQDGNVKEEQNGEMANLPIEEILDVKPNLSEPILEDVMDEEKQVDFVSSYNGLDKSLAGRGRKRRRNSFNQSFLLPFKRFLNPRSSRRKVRKLKPSSM